MPQGNRVSFEPDRKAFSADPLSYSAMAWHKWELAQFVATGRGEARPGPSGIDLKNPILWLTQAHALSEAARTLVTQNPSWETMPVWVRGVCDSQYCAAALMLVGYSLEVCLKAMLILRHGADTYANDEKKFHHHKLERLGEFIPDLSAKDRATLRALTHYIEWAGRYPDPGVGQEARLEELFKLAEGHEIAARDLFSVAGRVMTHANAVVQDVVGPA